jgi:hypothetical protein
MLIVVLAVLAAPYVSPEQVKAAGPVFQTDFETVTKQTANTLNLGVPNWFEFGGDGGASMWMEGLDRVTPGITCHSGSRCVGMELTDISKSRRSEFNIYPSSLVGNTLYVSVWLYLPGDWQLHSATDWYELVNPFFTDGGTYNPYAAFHIGQSDLTKAVFSSSLDVRDINGNLVTVGSVPVLPLPRGRWFNLQYYLYRDTANGVMMVWIDGALIYNVSGVQTMNPSVASWFTTIAKIYYDTSDKFSPYRLWVDDLAIYNTQQSPTSTSTSTSTTTTITTASTTSSTTTPTTTTTNTTTSSSTTQTSSTTSTASLTTSSSTTSSTNMTCAITYMLSGQIAGSSGRAASLLLNAQCSKPVGSYQFVVDLPLGSLISSVGSPTVTGFMAGGSLLTSGAQLRWFNLGANGGTSGNLTIPISIASGLPSASDVQVTLNSTTTIRDVAGIAAQVSPALPLSSNVNVIYPVTKATVYQALDAYFSNSVWAPIGRVPRIADLYDLLDICFAG